MTISLGNRLSFQPRFAPTGDLPSGEATPTRASSAVDSFERVGRSSSSEPRALVERADDARAEKTGVLIGTVAAVGLMALFFASPLLGTAAILISAVGIIAGAFATSRAKT